MAEQKYNPTQRSQMFLKATRQNYQMLPKQTIYQGATTVQFLLPKARLLTKMLIDFKAKVKISHDSETTVPVDDFTPYKLLRRLSIDHNVGFSPYVIGGKELAIYNTIRSNPSIIYPQSSNPSGYCYMPELTASPEGDTHEINFTVELPVSLNDRDPVGMILLQSAESQVTLVCDIANDNDLLDNKPGYSVKLLELSILPMLETFSLPAVSDAFPDISIIKLVSSRTEQFAGSGQNVIKLMTGTIYRKLAFYVTDDDGNPFEDEDFQSDIQLVFNQADTNYSINARTLRHLNELQLGFALPKGVYVLDFSNNGIPNYGGTRDYIDTELLTEFWLRFNSAKKGKISTITETLATAQ